MSRAHARQFVERGGGLGEVLEHFDGDHQVEGVVGEGQVGGVAEEAVEVAGAPFGREVLVGEVEPGHRRVGEAFDHP